MPSEAMASGKAKLEGWLPRLLDTAYGLALGIEVEKETADGPVVYKKEPFFPALVYLIDRAMGKPATEPNEIDQRLNLARALFIEEQLKKDWIDAQVLDLRARGERAITENAMWEKQFVTEEQEQANLRALASAATRGWQDMTPEEFERICPGVVDPSAALERLRGKVGRDMAAILEDAMSGGRKVADDDADMDSEDA